MAKEKELKIILDNIKKFKVLFFVINILFISIFMYFYQNTKGLKQELIDIRFVTESFPTVPDTLLNIKFYIEFASDYEFNIESKSFSLNEKNNKINRKYLIGTIDEYFLNYHNSLQELNSTLDDENSLDILKLRSSIDFYFQQINLFSRPYKLSKVYDEYNYSLLNYLTLLFSVIIFFNFSLYVLISIFNNLKK